MCFESTRLFMLEGSKQEDAFLSSPMLGQQDDECAVKPTLVLLVTLCSVIMTVQMDVEDVNKTQHKAVKHILDSFLRKELRL